MTDAMPPRLQAIMAAGEITTEDVLAVRRLVYPDGVIGAQEAEWILDIDAACAAQCEAWHMLYVEALTDYVVNQASPQGYVSPENAAWLMQRIGRDGVVSSASELELLVNVLEKSTASPPALSAYALAQVKEAVISGEGPLRMGRSLAPGRVTAGDVDLLRRTLYAAGGQQNIAITREEAEVLFDISDATAGAANDPSWPDLFVKALANHIMFASGFSVPTREEALHRSQWVEDTSVNVGGFFSRMASGLGSVMKSYVAPPERDVSAAFAATNETVSEAEAEWLASRINRDGVIAPHEEALLSFIKRESPGIHPKLKPLLDKVA